MPFDPLALPPLLTADLPGIGGRIKTVPEDFEVEEIPAYEPCGSGEFLFLWVEKIGQGAEYFVRQVAQRLGITPGDVGTAGLKDRHAVTRQRISVPWQVEHRLPKLDGEGIRLLEICGRHTNKLRMGHLHGNRFRILIRNTDPEAAARLGPLVERLQRLGLPNGYGAQRFGRDGETVLLGLAMLRKERTRRVTPFLRKFALSAGQSALFNYALTRRMEDGLYRRVLLGDVMAKWPVGGMFVAREIEREQERLEAREIVPAGPIYGRKMFPAEGDAALREGALLNEVGLTPDSFEGFGKLVQGTRRHNLVYLDDLTATVEPEGVRCSFKLPPGSYATLLLRELMHEDRLEGEEGSADPATTE